MAPCQRSSNLLALPFLLLLLAQVTPDLGRCPIRWLDLIIPRVPDGVGLSIPLALPSQQVPSPEAAESTPGTRTRKIGGSGPSSVFSLFNLKAKSKFWTESVIRTEYDDLEGSASRDSSKGMLNFTRAGNIANYMSLAEVDSIYLPIPVNFIFIGFDGKGGHEFKLGPEELERWFTKIDHIFEYTRIPPVGEVLTPFYKTSVKKLRQYELPLVSHVNHNFSVHAIHMGEDVLTVFELAIKVLSRREDLADSRKGFSESEINLLREGTCCLADIEKGVNRKPLYESHPLSSFSWASTDSMDMCFTHLVQGDWSKKCKEALSKFEVLKEGKSKDDIVYDKAVQILHGPKDEMHDILENALKSSGFKGLHAECLTDIWVGRERFAFVDLSAGPFAWGPSVGGDGVRTELSLPNIAKTVGAVAEVTEEEAEEKLQGTIRERFSSFGEDYHAVDILLAEIDVYELFAFKHCVGRRVQLALCKGTFWLSLSEEPALMMAFSLARRAAAVPLLLVNGGHSNHRSTLEVPIFWFIHSEPLLLDKHYQAKALSNMVVVVQSDDDSWESHLQCNGRPILWDLRKPVKAAIAASAEYISGLLPSHLVYSHAHETAVEDWTWSVGCNPLSITSNGWQLSEFQQDVIGRNYIITSVEESIQTVNSAIQRLVTERASILDF
nr:unnamed protein product [Digitaria exilis]